MTGPVLCPYPTLSDGDAVLSVTGVRIDGKPRPDWLRKNEWLVALFEQAGNWGGG